MTVRTARCSGTPMTVLCFDAVTSPRGSLRTPRRPHGRCPRSTPPLQSDRAAVPPAAPCALGHVDAILPALPVVEAPFGKQPCSVVPDDPSAIEATRLHA